MADVVLKNTFLLRRDTASAWAEANPVLQSGEPGFETDTGKLKIGDGTTVWNELAYLTDDPNGVIVFGYYLNDKFYTDSTYTEECVKSVSKMYVDQNQNGTFYVWNGQKFTPSVNVANDLRAGIMKLYQDGGSNTDGAMSQKAVTEGVQSISFNVDMEDEECLIIDVPWDNVHGRY